MYWPESPFFFFSKSRGASSYVGACRGKFDSVQDVFQIFFLYTDKMHVCIRHKKKILNNTLKVL